MRKMTNVFMILFLLSLAVLSGCGNQTSGQNSEGSDAKNGSDNGKTKVVFWHAMGGDLKPVLENIVKKFNEKHPDIEVDPVFQGTYEEALTKYRSVGGTKNAPAIIQTFEVGTKYMIDSGYIQPVQKFIDQDHYDINQWEPNIRKYYQVNGKQYSMPFNSSTPVLVYNKDAFKKAGLDPNKPPQTYSELMEDAKKLTVKSGNKTAQYGFSMLNYGWFFEELLAEQGAYYVNHKNGRAKQATKAAFNGPEGVKVFNLLNNMNKDGSFFNVGSNWDDIRAAFVSGKVAMYLDSSSGINSIVDNSKFSVGAGYLPHPDGKDPQGVVIGGASLWMSKGIGDKKQQAAWEFMKYLASPEVQAEWHTKSGYFAINPKAYDSEIVKEQHKKYPQLETTVNQLHDTKSTPATQGALISVFPESRQKVVTALEKLYQGGDPQQLLDEAAKDTDRAMEIANKTKK
ncbi:ABC transporter substrate-binding protein [Falsibacillus albus]|uniref:ABC transporter substrate-binding protein n=1 Tax=Falsibacillus albus TaxID=2478915 RepID=A0A3L7JV88_9BACI|nr:ABC transporter substrate-binding protein [Falsibacillus albus]RLQ94039.1 ABC transporter substrate-binding protein [Falsibacillus albus]